MPNLTRHPTLFGPLNVRGDSGSRRFAKLNSIAAALLFASLIHHGQAHALALGRIAIQSALGEPLRAEVDVLEISPEEAANLRVGLGSVDAFRVSGMEFNQALSGIRISLQRRADGRAYLRLEGSRPVNEPFVDMVLEANWPTGRAVRGYTVLLDPPKTASAAPAILNAGVAPAPAAPVVAQVPSPVPPLAPPAPLTAAPQSPSRVAQTPAAPKPVNETSPGSTSKQVRVARGDTAGRIAAANLPENTSLDQILVAMLRSNPSAFIGGNVNLVKAGAILKIPSAEDTARISSTEARRIVVAQSRDFNEFRRRLATAVPAANVTTADRQASGQVQARVDDKAPAAATQDKLTLSKGTAASQGASEDKIAKERQAKESAARVAELSRNIDELSKIGPTAPAGSAPAAPAAPGKPGVADSIAAVPAVVTTAATAPAPEAAKADTEPAVDPASAAVPTPSPVVAAPTPAPTPAPVEETSFVDQLGDNPWLLPGVGALLALLGALALYRLNRKKKGSNPDSSFLESRNQHDSFFGSGGGQHVDTSEAAQSGSSMLYSPSQLDAVGDVDPIAEADVYLAYGRDLQAEEILKEAMRNKPTRVAIHNKLLEIYAKRCDTKAFEVVANEAYALTKGHGPEWAHACDLGKVLDPGNPLYLPGGSPAVKPVATDSGGPNTVPFGISTLTQPGSTSGFAKPNMGLDLDLTQEDAAVSGKAPAVTGRQPTRTPGSSHLLSDAATSLSNPVSRPLEFELNTPSRPRNDGDLPDFNLDTPDNLTPLGHDPSVRAAGQRPMAFDLGDLSLDLNTPSRAQSDRAGEGDSERLLDNKLSLAEEFRAIGDMEGARALAEEVLSESTGTQKAKARAFLTKLA